MDVVDFKERGFVFCANCQAFFPIIFMVEKCVHFDIWNNNNKNAKWIWKIIRRKRAIDSIQNSSGQLGN